MTVQIRFCRAYKSIQVPLCRQVLLLKNRLECHLLCWQTHQLQRILQRSTNGVSILVMFAPNVAAAFGIGVSPSTILRKSDRLMSAQFVMDAHGIIALRRPLY